MSVNRFEILPLIICAKPEVLAQASISGGDAITMIVDIREEWATPAAEAQVRAFFDRRAADLPTGVTVLRISMPDDISGQQALARLAALRPDGFVLSGCRGVADIQELDVRLRVAEAQQGLKAGSTAILAEAGEKPDFFLERHSLRDVSGRLAGLVFDGAALSEMTASRGSDVPSAGPGGPVLFARATAVLKARQADLACYELLGEEPLSTKELAARSESSLADGFSGIIVRNGAQLAALAAG